MDVGSLPARRGVDNRFNHLNGLLSFEVQHPDRGGANAHLSLTNRVRAVGVSGRARCQLTLIAYVMVVDDSLELVPQSHQPEQLAAGCSRTASQAFWSSGSARTTFRLMPSDSTGSSKWRLASCCGTKPSVFGLNSKFSRSIDGQK